MGERDAKAHATRDQGQHLDCANIFCARHPHECAVSESSSYQRKKQSSSKVHGNLLFKILT
jgi:hypothetical protein